MTRRGSGIYILRTKPMEINSLRSCLTKSVVDATGLAFQRAVIGNVSNTTVGTNRYGGNDFAVGGAIVVGRAMLVDLSSEFDDLELVRSCDLPGRRGSSY